MSVSLSKGGSISLAKQSSTGLSSITLGVGWDVAKAKPKGLFGSVFGGGGTDSIDLDASALVFDAGGKILDTVWFRQLQSQDGSIRHSGDNLTGEGAGDDESIVIDLTRLQAQAEHIVLTVNSFRGQTFDKVDNAYARVVNNAGKVEMTRFLISESGSHTGLILARLSRAGGEWTFKAIGLKTEGRTVNELADQAKALLAN